MVEKKPIWHEITGVQYDGWQHTEEEDGRRKRRQHGGVFRIQNAPTANPTTTRQQVSGNQANNFGQPFTTDEERKRKKQYND